jgi:hypothetical protein
MFKNPCSAFGISKVMPRKMKLVETAGEHLRVIHFYAPSNKAILTLLIHNESNAAYACQNNGAKIGDCLW